MPKKKQKRRTDRNLCGRTVYRLREALGLTQAELAARAQVNGWDVSQYAIKRIELGEREVTDIELVMLGQILKVPAAALLAS